MPVCVQKGSANLSFTIKKERTFEKKKKTAITPPSDKHSTLHGASLYGNALLESFDSKDWDDETFEYFACWSPSACLASAAYQLSASACCRSLVASSIFCTAALRAVFHLLSTKGGNKGVCSGAVSLQGCAMGSSRLCKVLGMSKRTSLLDWKRRHILI